MEIFHETIERKGAFSFLTKAIIGTVGFILSPLSWWNDLVVNVPLSYAFAWIVGKLLHSFIVIHKWLFMDLFVLGYFLTNLIGFLMIHYSISGLKKNKTISIKSQIVVSIAYTIIIIVFFSSSFCDPGSVYNILPAWVKP